MTKDQRDDAHYLALDGYSPNAIAKKLGISESEELTRLYWEAQEPMSREISNDLIRLSRYGK